MPVDLVQQRETVTADRAATGAGAPGAALDLILSAWCWVVLLAVTLLQYGRGLLLSRRPDAAVWSGVLRDWARGLIALGGMGIRVDGSPPAAGPAVLVANHQSAFDIALLAALIPPPFAFVARADLFSLPIIGGVLRRGVHVAVGGDEAAEGLTAVRRMAERLAAGCVVVVFAEGTRSARGRVRRLRAGAFLAARAAGCPVVPVAIAGTRHVVAKGRRLLRPSRMAVAFLEPLTVTDEVASARGRRALQRRLGAAVRSLDPSTGPRHGARA